MTSNEALSASPPSSPTGKKKGRIPKLHSPFHKRKNKQGKHKDEDGHVDIDDTHPTIITAVDNSTLEESDSKEIESCLSEGGTNIQVVVNNASGNTEPVEEQGFPKQSVDDLAHPSLSSVYIRDVQTSKGIPINSEPVRISNEWFDMDMVLMLRTPNVDDKTAPVGSEYNQKVADYFRSKQRRFEFQYQVKLKKKPENKDLFYAIQWEKPVKMGMIQKAFVSACLAFLRRTRPTVHCTPSGTTPEEDGGFEKLHLANFVERGLDRVVITPPGETPPTLGGEIHEDLDHYKKRKAGEIRVDFNTEDTYTLALWNANVDWIDWKVVGIPGISSFDLKKVLGNQSLSIFLYMLDKDRGNANHFQRDIETIVNLEISSEHQEEDKKEKHHKHFFW